MVSSRLRMYKHRCSVFIFVNNLNYNQMNTLYCNLYIFAVIGAIVCWVQTHSELVSFLICKVIGNYFLTAAISSGIPKNYEVHYMLQLAYVLLLLNHQWICKRPQRQYSLCNKQWSLFSCCCNNIPFVVCITDIDAVGHYLFDIITNVLIC